MQPLVFIAVVIAMAALGVGYLGNDIALQVQQFGVGDQDIPSPVTNAGLTIIIEREFGATLQGNTVVTGAFKDFIVDCVFRSPNNDLFPGTKIFCKLLDGDNINTDHVIAEGITMLGSTVLAGTPITVPIDMIVQNNVDFVHNVVIVVQDPPS